MAASWESRLTASMVISKRGGMSFTAAWKLALLENPPRSSVEREIVGAVRGFMEDAWFGRRPALRHFSLDMLAAGDGSGEARSSRSVRVDSLVAA